VQKEDCVGLDRAVTNSSQSMSDKSDFHTQMAALVGSENIADVNHIEAATIEIADIVRKVTGRSGPMLPRSDIH
jgi:hypothetical protein